MFVNNHDKTCRLLKPSDESNLLSFSSSCNNLPQKYSEQNPKDFTFPPACISTMEFTTNDMEKVFLFDHLRKGCEAQYAKDPLDSDVCTTTTTTLLLII